MAALVLGNAVLVSRLMAEGAGSPVTRGAAAAGHNDASDSSFKELRGALRSVQVSFSADVKALSITGGKDRAQRSGDRPQETSTIGSNTETVSGGSSSGSNSTGSTSGGSSSSGSDTTDSGSGGSSGGSSGDGDSGSDDTSGGGPGGGGGGSGGGGGDTGGGGSSGGGGGGG